MKPLKLTEEIKDNLLKLFIEKFRKELNNFDENMNETKISFSSELSTVAKEKIKILYDPVAYLKMKGLVDFYNTEVGWYGLVDKIDDHKYYVYDVKVCKQYVDGAKVDTEDEDVIEFFNALTDDEAEHIHFQAHSHVKMFMSASGVDLQNQADVIRNMGKSGFFIFQIWNKSGEISTYLYDLDNNMYYDKKDVEIEIVDGNNLISDFLAETSPLVMDRKPYQYYHKSEVPVKGTGKKNEYSYLPGYYERWDF